MRKTITRRGPRPYSRDPEHYKKFLAACPGWARPDNGWVLHFFNEHGISLCLAWDYAETGIMLERHKSGNKCKTCINAVKDKYPERQDANDDTAPR